MIDFDAIFRKYHHKLFLYALKFVDDEDDAQDIVQNVFVAVWENGKSNLDDPLLQSYLFNSVRNSCLNYIKHQKVIRKFEKNTALQIKEMEILHYQSVEKSLIENEEMIQIEKTVNSLSDIYKEVILLSRFEGLKNAEIAERLDLPVRTIETRIFRALKMLRDKLSNNPFLILFCFGLTNQNNLSTKSSY